MKTMNHGEYQKRLRKLSDAELRYVIKDAGGAIKAQPMGENAGYYMDEVHYAIAEINRRAKSNKSTDNGDARQVAVEAAIARLGL